MTLRKTDLTLHYGTVRGGSLRSPAVVDEVRERWFRARDEGIPLTPALRAVEAGTSE